MAVIVAVTFPLATYAYRASVGQYQRYILRQCEKESGVERSAWEQAGAFDAYILHLKGNTPAKAATIRCVLRNFDVSMAETSEDAEGQGLLVLLYYSSSGRLYFDYYEKAD